MGKRYLLLGGAGFIGSHCVARLIAKESNLVTVYDNFCTGRSWHVPIHPRVKLVRGDIKDLAHLTSVMPGHDQVYHFATNADIALAEKNPSVDFREGTMLTQNVLEAMRLGGVKRIIYTSGSGVYGDLGEKPLVEDALTMLPISPYGASKLASEALISAYVHMFGFQAFIFRFANICGPRQTHGVAYAFVCRLLKNPKELTIFGDGNQSKSYIYVDDVIDALTHFDHGPWKGLQIFNVSTEDYITVTDIAHMATEALGLRKVTFNYTGGSRGWKGDVPVVRIDSSKLRAAGWSNKYGSREAMQKAIEALIRDARAGRFAEDDA